jgi:hypothetical protein
MKARRAVLLGRTEVMCKRLLMVVVVFVTLQACNGRSPTAPTDVRRVDTTNLIGTWEGPMPTGMPGEEWTAVILKIDLVGDGIAGYLRPRAGVDHPVTVTLSPSSGASIRIQPPSSSTVECNSYTVGVTAIEYKRDEPFALAGRTFGKCPNTLIGNVRLFRR